MRNKRIYSIISHTHWDREWYLPFEQFRTRLVDLIDNLLVILDKDENYRFHLDAQTVVLEDYLEIRPHKKSELKKYIAQGRILVGPWYVQNDLHLTSGEATVRNLLLGTETAESFGKCTAVGYAADQFGLCSQLPQILCGFGIDTCIFGRGYKRGQTQFYWNGQDGSSLLCEHMAWWYNNLQRLPSVPKNALMLIRERGALCAEKAKGSSCLLMNGVDHLEAQEDLTEIMNGVRPLLSENEEILQDTMPEYMDRLKKEIAELGLALEEYTGEMRDGGQKNVLTGTLSSRIHLKQQNARLQARIEDKTEPLYAFLSCFGLGTDSRDYMNYVWKNLIKNHPHDSICGCSVDAVHRHMVDRNETLFETLDDLDQRAEDCYMKHLDRTRIPENGFFITCFNNSVIPFEGVMQATVDIPTGEDKGGFTLSDANGKEVPFEVLEIKRNVGKRILSPINLPGIKNVNRYVIAFRVKLAQMAKKTLVGVPTDYTLEVTADGNKLTRNLENEFISVHINKNGTVDIKNKKTGKLYKNALLIEDNRDSGNLYNYELGDESEMATNASLIARVEKVKDTFLIQQRRISYTIKGERKGKPFSLPVQILLTLNRSSKALDVKVTLDNTYGDHRTRVFIPTYTNSDENFASQPFDIVKRNRVSDFADDDMHPNSGFVCVDGDGEGIAVLNEGLYEYQHMQNESSDIALTLLRCTGKIATYMADAETPEGQCLGTYTLRFALYPYSADHLDAAVCHMAQRFIAPPYTSFQHNDYNKFIGGRPFVQSAAVPINFYRPLEHPNTVIPLETKAFELTRNDRNAMMLSAYKCAHDGCGQIVRLFNTAESETVFELRPNAKIKHISLCNLKETKLETLSFRKKLVFTAKPKQILTFKLS